MWNIGEDDFWRSPFRKEWLKIHAAWAVVLLVFAIGIAALSIWSLRWRNGEWLASLGTIAFVACLVWGNFAMLKARRAARDLNAVITPRFYSGPRPEDPDELKVWWWGRQWIYAMIAMASGMLALVAIGFIENR